MQDQTLDKVDVTAVFCASTRGTEEVIKAYREFLEAVAHIKLMHTNVDIAPKVFSDK